MADANGLSADVVIIGGAVIGSAVAYYLSTIGKFARGRVVIVERDMTFAEASTARSAGGIRQQFSTPENIALSQVTLGLLRNLKETFGPSADVGFREQGYLLLASGDGEAVLRGNNEVQKRAGADIHIMPAADLAGRFPWLNTDGVACGAFGRTGEGWLDPVSLMTLFRRAAEDRGVQILKDTVVDIDRQGTKITSVKLATGRRIKTGCLVNAAGPAAGAVAKLAGITLPVEPRKRFVYVVDCKAATPELHAAPLTVDPSGVWFRPEGRQFITGVSPEEHKEPMPGDLDQIDHTEFEEIVWPAIAARVPLFEAIKVTSAWAGHYDYNTLDQNAIIGAHPEVSNFYLANGFSGHGLQQSGGAGRAIAELIVHGGYRTIDLTRFGYGRVDRHEPLFELNII
jgi:FAD-dependent oxidoreductase domain-containing protein 1